MFMGEDRMITGMPTQQTLDKWKKTWKWKSLPALSDDAFLSIRKSGSYLEWRLPDGCFFIPSLSGSGRSRR